MFKNFRDKIALSGITVLMIGITLLIFTFISAYGFLTAGLSIITSTDLTQTFGDALGPLIATCIRIMYLGVMGWIGSLVTIRGVTIIAHTPPMPTALQPQQPAAEAKPQPQPQAQTQPQAQKPKTEKPVEKPKAEKPKEEKPKEEKPKEEVKAPEPEIIVLPPEQVAQTPPTPEQKPQQNGSPTQ
jgi:cytoskeletal protein RodZ